MLGIWNRDVSWWNPLVCESNVLLLGKSCPIHLMVQISYRLIGRYGTGKSLQREGGVGYGSMVFSESNPIVGDCGWLCIIDPDSKLTRTDHGQVRVVGINAASAFQHLPWRQLQRPSLDSLSSICTLLGFQTLDTYWRSIHGWNSSRAGNRGILWNHKKRHPAFW